MMSYDELMKFPCFDYKGGEKESISNCNCISPVDCAVCLESFKVGDKCRLLPMCKHTFHARCIDKWLLKTPICPICRARTDSSEADEVSNSTGFDLA